MIKSWDYKKEYSLLKKRIIFSIDKTLRSGKLFFGHEVLKFEKEFLKKNKSSNGLSVASGEDEINLSLNTLNIEKKDS